MQGMYQAEAVRHQLDVEPLDELIRVSPAREHLFSRWLLIIVVLFLCWAFLFPYNSVQVVMGTVTNVLQSAPRGELFESTQTVETEQPSFVLFNMAITTGQVDTLNAVTQTKFKPDAFYKGRQNAVRARDSFTASLVSTRRNDDGIMFFTIRASVEETGVNSIVAGDPLFMRVLTGSRSPVATMLSHFRFAEVDA